MGKEALDWNLQGRRKREKPKRRRRSTYEVRTWELLIISVHMSSSLLIADIFDGNCNVTFTYKRMFIDDKMVADNCIKTTLLQHLHILELLIISVHTSACLLIARWLLITVLKQFCYICIPLSY